MTKLEVNLKSLLTAFSWKMLKFLKEPQPEKPTEAEKKAWEDRFQKLAKELEFEGETQIEIRFNNLDYDLVGMLQADELVDRTLTPQSKASIRIVLGTISSMQDHNDGG